MVSHSAQIDIVQIRYSRALVNGAILYESRHARSTIQTSCETSSCRVQPWNYPATVTTRPPTDTILVINPRAVASPKLPFFVS